MKRSKAFTLIELLVVIGIITFLMGFISLAAHIAHIARELANKTLCISNQHHIFVTGIVVYANDNDSRLIPMNQVCYWYDDPDNNGMWYTNILVERYRISAEFDNPRIGDVKWDKESVWTCRSVSQEEGGWGAGYGLYEIAHPYPSCPEDLYEDLYCHMPTLANIWRPAEVVSLADAGERKNSRLVPVIGIHPPNDVNMGLKLWGQEGAHEVAPRHLGKAVLTFLDGHTEVCDYENYIDKFGRDMDGDLFPDLCICKARLSGSQ